MNSPDANQTFPAVPDQEPPVTGAMGYPKRLAYLLLGQVVSAVGIVAMVQANIGLDPWNCLHQGLSNVTGIPFGTCSILVGATATLVAFLLKEPLGLGTVVSVVVPGVLINLLQDWALIPQMQQLWSGALMMLAAQVVLALGTTCYMAAALGAGPRDALMVSVSRAMRVAPGLCRTALEVAAVALGWGMGAKAGVGTVLAALTIGPILQGVFHLFRFDPRAIRQLDFPALWRDIKARRAGASQTEE